MVLICSIICGGSMYMIDLIGLEDLFNDFVVIIIIIIDLS